MRLARSRPGLPPESAGRLALLTPLALAALAVMTLAGCSSGEGLFSGDKIDYRTTATKTRPLDVPPDLTQLARETRYQPQGGVVSAAAVAAGSGNNAAPAPAAAASASVALSQLDGMRIEHRGQQRWLVVPKTPEELWPLLRGFWEKNGFTLAIDNPQAGVLETNWAENRAKLPDDAVRSTIGKIFGGLFDSGERDLFRTRVERGDAGTEIYVSHRGMVEEYDSSLHETTKWRARPNDPGLEAEMLSRLMLALAGRDAAPPAGSAVAATQAAVVPEAPARARALVQAGTAQMEVDEPFERAWRRVGLALDRGGFTVEDRDRAQGLYYVRYIDPTTAGQEEPGFFARLFSDAKGPGGPVRYRITLKANGPKTVISVLTSAGAPETGDNGKRIVAQLVNELK